jgi:hypothetical protein
MQLDMCDRLVPCKVLSKGSISVHAEDPHSVLLVPLPVFNVGPMVVLEILHTSLLDTIEPAKVQFSYMRNRRIVNINRTVKNLPMQLY